MMFSRAILVAVFIATAHAAALDTSSGSSSSTAHAAAPDPSSGSSSSTAHAAAPDTSSGSSSSTAHAAAPDTSSGPSGSTGSTSSDALVGCECACYQKNSVIDYSAFDNVTCGECETRCTASCNVTSVYHYCLYEINKSWVGTYEAVEYTSCLEGKEPSLGGCGTGCSTAQGCACLTGDVEITMVDDGNSYHLSGEGKTKDGNTFPTNATFKIIEPARLNVKAIADSIYGFPTFSTKQAVLGFNDFSAGVFEVSAFVDHHQCDMTLVPKKKPKYTLIIVLSVGGFLALVILAYCCCCRGKKEDKSSYKPLTANHSNK